MKRRIKVLAAITALVLSLQMGVSASLNNDLSIESEQTATIGLMVQPRGLYLDVGKCAISPQSGYVTVWGSTSAYSSISEISVELTVYREISTNVWSYVWSSKFTDYNTDYAYFNSRNVSVPAGRYKVEGTHTTKHGGRTESNTSVSGIVTVY